MLQSIHERPPASQIKIVERYFKQARERQRLAWSGSHLTWEWPASECGPDLPLWILSIATARLMLSDDMRLPARLREAGLPVAVSRHQQEPHPPLVRHEDLRQSHEGSPLQGPAPAVMSIAALTDPRKKKRVSFNLASWRRFAT